MIIKLNNGVMSNNFNNSPLYVSKKNKLIINNKKNIIVKIIDDVFKTVKEAKHKLRVRAVILKLNFKFEFSENNSNKIIIIIIVNKTDE